MGRASPREFDGLPAVGGLLAVVVITTFDLDDYVYAALRAGARGFLLYRLETLAHTCAEMAAQPRSIFPVCVVQLWAVGDILGAVREIETVTVALGVDLPVDEVPWLSEPRGAQHWASATRLTKNPIVPLWRSIHAPIWNHYIDRPALLWDSTGGVAETTMAALR